MSFKRPYSSHFTTLAWSSFSNALKKWSRVNTELQGRRQKSGTDMDLPTGCSEYHFWGLFSEKACWSLQIPNASEATLMTVIKKIGRCYNGTRKRGESQTLTKKLPKPPKQYFMKDQGYLLPITLWKWTNPSVDQSVHRRRGAENRRRKRTANMVKRSMAELTAAKSRPTERDGVVELEAESGSFSVGYTKGEPGWGGIKRPAYSTVSKKVKVKLVSLKKRSGSLTPVHQIQKSSNQARKA